MRAIVLTAYGDTSKLELVRLPRLNPGPNQVKVRMAGAGVNPIDWKLRSGVLHATTPLSFPAVVGREVSGEVVAIGPGVSEFALGARVMGLVSGGYAAFALGEAQDFAHVPVKMDLADAGALPLALLAGAQLVEEGLNPQAGDVVLVTGAVGSVGRTAVFAAKARGAKVWAGVRGRQRAAAEALGAHGVVALDKEAELDALPALDGIADTIGGETVTRLLAKLRPGGKVATVVGMPADGKNQGAAIKLVHAHGDSARLATLAQAVAEGQLVIPIALRIPLARAGEGQTHAEHQSAGKVVLTGRQSNAAARAQCATREHVLKLIADGELADLSQGSAGERIGNGDEFLDLEQLGRGVQRGQTGTTPTGQVLARKSVHEDTWRRILRQLAAAPP
jgi:NADPH:quinone reductase-like Zn-dependent oxidoreductase